MLRKQSSMELDEIFVCYDCDLMFKSYADFQSHLPDCKPGIIVTSTENINTSYFWPDLTTIPGEAV